MVARREQEGAVRAARRMSDRRSSGTSTLTPRAVSTSAPPVREDRARLPCLATGTPQPAITKVTAVETFSVPAVIASGAADIDRVGGGGDVRSCVPASRGPRR